MNTSSSLCPLSNYRGTRRLYRGISVFPLIAKLLLMNRAADANEIVEFALKNPVIQPAQVRAELRQFAAIVAERRPKTVLEIGTFQGGTLFTLCRLAHPAATVISVDLPGGRFGGGYRWLRVPLFKSFAVKGQCLHLLRGDSHKSETREKVTAILGDQKLDLLFIDGDHTCEGVRADFNLYSPLVQPGGIVVFHDIAEHPPAMGCDVARFWDEIKYSYRYSEIIEDRHQGWAGLGLLYL